MEDDHPNDPQRATNEQAQPVTREEIEEFSKKLDSWSQQLPARQSALLRLMLARAKHVEPSDAQGYVVNSSIKDAASMALERFAGIASVTAGPAPQQGARGPQELTDRELAGVSGGWWVPWATQWLELGPGWLQVMK